MSLEHCGVGFDIYKCKFVAVIEWIIGFVAYGNFWWTAEFRRTYYFNVGKKLRNMKLPEVMVIFLRRPQARIKGESRGWPEPPPLLMVINDFAIMRFWPREPLPDVVSVFA